MPSATTTGPESSPAKRCFTKSPSSRRCERKEASEWELELASRGDSLSLAGADDVCHDLFGQDVLSKVREALPSHDVIWRDHECVRNTLNADLAIHVVGSVDGHVIVHWSVLHELGNLLRVFVSHADHDQVFAVLLLPLCKLRDDLTAAGAPGGPEVDLCF